MELYHFALPLAMHDMRVVVSLQLCQQNVFSNFHIFVSFLGEKWCTKVVLICTSHIFKQNLLYYYILYCFSFGLFVFFFSISRNSIYQLNLCLWNELKIFFSYLVMVFFVSSFCFSGLWILSLSKTFHIHIPELQRIPPRCYKEFTQGLFWCFM